MTTRYSPDDYSEYGAVWYSKPIADAVAYPIGYDPFEQEDLLDEFHDMLKQVTEDGGRKRAAGEKVNWKVDPGHEDAMFRHLERWANGELVDRDSGAHPLVHVAWRALAIAFQEEPRMVQYITERLSGLD